MKNLPKVLQKSNHKNIFYCTYEAIHFSSCNKGAKNEFLGIILYARLPKAKCTDQRTEGQQPKPSV